MTPYDAATRERLLFRRQFVLGPRAVEEFPSWRHVALGGGLHLTAHPDLGLTRVAAGGRSIVLLGYILDPTRPAAGDEEILHRLLDAMGAGESALELTTPLGGRWVLIVTDGARTSVFGDAAGLRHIVYTAGAAPGQVWCASQPGLLAEIVRAPEDPEAAAFVRAVEPSRHTGMVWFPGASTPYRGIRVLLPNHVLDVASGRAERYWPGAALPGMPRRAAVAAAAGTLQGLMEAAAHRFLLMPAMTAGWDSRVALAGTRALSGRLFYYSLLYGDKPRDDPDVTVPTRLAARLGLRHEIIDRRDTADEAFAAVYRRNVRPGYLPNCAAVQALLERSPSDGVNVSGDAGEIPRWDYASRGLDVGEVTARDLAKLSRLPAHPFVLGAFDEWLEGARVVGRHVPLRHLFAWEQEAGRLQAMLLAELDIARDSFPPFSCRSLLVTLLSAPVRDREEPTFYLFRGLLRRLWPEVLAEPINGRPQVGAEAALRRTLDGLHLVRLVPVPAKRLVKRLIRWAGFDTSLET